MSHYADLRWHFLTDRISNQRTGVYFRYFGDFSEADPKFIIDPAPNPGLVLHWDFWGKAVLFYRLFREVSGGLDGITPCGL